MTRPLAPLSRHLLTRSDLAQLGIQAGRILTWLARGWLDQVGNLPDDDTVGDPVFAVTTRELRDELAQQLRSIGKDTVVFSPMRVRSLLLRAMLPVRADAPTVDLTPPSTTMSNEPVPAPAPTQDPVTEALLDPAVTGALHLAAEDLEEEVAKVLELAREEAHQEAIERAAELAAAAPSEESPQEPEPQTPWHEDDGEEGEEDEDEGEFFDAADLAAELGLLPPTARATPTPATTPTEADEPVETNEQEAAATAAGAAIPAEPAPAVDEPVEPTAVVMAPSEPSPAAEPEVASEPALPVAEPREPEATATPTPEPEILSQPPPEPAAVAQEPIVAEEAPAHANADRDAEVAVVPAPAEAQPEPGPAPHEEPPELPPMSTLPAGHEDVIAHTPGTGAPVSAPTLEAEAALDALLAEAPAAAGPSTELADAADSTPFVEPTATPQAPAEPAPVPVAAAMEVEAPVAAAVEAPVETPVDAAVETALAAAAAPSPVGTTAAPQPAAPALVPEQVTAAAMQRVDSFLGELRHVLVELANRPQPQPAPIDVQPLVAAVQQGFVHAGEQAKATDSALASLTTRLGEFGEKVEHGVALAVHAALGPRSQTAQPVPALVTAPSFVVAKTERSTIALFAIGFLLLCWTGIFWFKTGNTRIAVSTLVGANVVGCCLLLGRSRSS